MFKPIETERLIIRKFRPDDFTELYEYLSDSNVVRYEPYEPYTWEQTKREAELKKNVYFKRDSSGNPIWQDTLQYAILLEEWKQKYE